MPQTYVPRFDLTQQQQQQRFASLQKKTTVVLHPRRVSVPNVRASKMGGRIAWPRVEPWPQCPKCGDRRPMMAILQLCRSDVPELWFPENKDLFQMLWCPRGDHLEPEYYPIAETCWRNEGEIGELLETVPEPVGREDWNTLFPEECSVSPERVEELPSAFELDTETTDLLDTWIRDNGQQDLQELGMSYEDGIYQCSFSVAPGTKVGGMWHGCRRTGHPNVSVARIWSIC